MYWGYIGGVQVSTFTAYLVELHELEQEVGVAELLLGLVPRGRLLQRCHDTLQAGANTRPLLSFT